MQTIRDLRRLRATAAQWRRNARNALINRFYGFSQDELGRSLRSLGVSEGDVVCVHSTFENFTGFQGNVADAIRVLQESVGVRGGIIMPTQPFLTSALEYIDKNPVTDLARSPSHMGFMSEILRRSPDVKRSIHPTHPVAAWGEAGTALLGRDWESRTPCGRGTAYHRLLEVGGKILFLGTGVQPMTFYHYTEEVIESQMPISPFTKEEYQLKTRDRDGTIYESSMRLHDKELSGRRRMSLLVPELKTRQYWNEAKIGRLEMVLLEASHVLEAVRSMADQNRFCYLPAT